MDHSPPTAGEEEAQLSTCQSKRGGWITIPFILATTGSLTLASQGWLINLIVYMIAEFNVKTIDSAQIWNVVHGCTSMFPILGAIFADSFLGCFSVIWISSLISLLGVVVLLLTATLDSLRPSPCESGSSSCSAPTIIQLGVVYAGIALGILGIGGSRYTIGAMGADQLRDLKHQASFFNWFFFVLNTSSAICTTAIIYVETNVSWGWGFGICVTANLVGLAIFLSGNRFYRHVRPRGSPFTGLARVLVVAIRKRKAKLSPNIEDYYQKPQGHEEMTAARPSKSFKFLNRAALIATGDIQADGSIAKLWKLCTLQQVEDLKTLIRLFPLWSTGIILCIPLTTLSSFATLQALAMDRHMGPHFKIPPGSLLVFMMIATCITIIVLDGFLYPMWEKLIGRFPPPLQRIGVGHILSTLSMALSAIVESKRLKVAQSHNLENQNGAIVPMSAFWLVPQLALAGIAEAFHLPGNSALYYQEFPTTLRSTSTAMVAMYIAIAFYLNTALVGVVHRVTDWLPNNINGGRMDNLYWVLFVVGVINFAYYLVCAWLYKGQGAAEVVDVESSSDN